MSASANLARPRPRRSRRTLPKHDQRNGRRTRSTPTARRAPSPGRVLRSRGSRGRRAGAAAVPTRNVRLVKATVARGSTNVRSTASSTTTTATTPTATRRRRPTPSSGATHRSPRSARPPGPLAFADPPLLLDPSALGRARRLVATRGGSTWSAAASRSRNRSSASSRFCNWERRSDATIRTRGPSFSRRRARWRGPSDGDDSMSKSSSTRVFDVLACWPPGPPEELNRHSSSPSAIAHDRETRTTPRLHTESLRAAGAHDADDCYDRVSGLYLMRCG